MTIRVRLMSDHSGWPLWDEEGGTGPENWPKLPDELKARLTAWEGYWARNFHHAHGWAPGSREEYAAQGKELLVAVSRELGPDYTVTLHL